MTLLNCLMLWGSPKSCKVILQGGSIVEMSVDTAEISFRTWILNRFLKYCMKQSEILLQTLSR